MKSEQSCHRQVPGNLDGTPAVTTATLRVVSKEEVSGKGLQAVTQSKCHNFYLRDDNMFNRKFSPRFRV